MSFSLKPDYEISKKRYEAFWEQEIIDRPPVSISLPVEVPITFPDKQYKTYQDRWLDIEYRALAADAQMRNREYLADSLPIYFPNMGPEIFSAWCGCGYEYGADTTWSTPCIYDWQKDADDAVLNLDHPLFIKTVEFTKLLLEYGKGHFIVGLTDFHPGADHLAALRDPQNLAMDLIDFPEAVQKKLAESYVDYYKAYDIFYRMLRQADMPITSWIPLICEGRYYIPSNDFSCMISPAMFESFFLPGIIDECHFYERSIYHLDGPGALRHLDTLLDIKELDAVQWICGAGNEGYHRWVDVYQKIQRAGKSMQLFITLDELPMVFETLRPVGVWFSEIKGIHDRDTADKVIRRIKAWS